jgi:hypothetical protein
MRHAHAVEMAHEGVPLVVIQRQLGHANLGEGGRGATLLNLLCALGDTVATLLERRDRGSWERAVLGSVPVDAVDVAWWTNALRYV